MWLRGMLKNDAHHPLLQITQQFSEHFAPSNLCFSLYGTKLKLIEQLGMMLRTKHYSIYSIRI